MRTLAVVVHPANPEAAAVAQLVREAAADVGLDAQAEMTRADAVVAIGGDGTVLHALRQALAADVPLLGVNVGAVGFLAEASPDDAAAAIARLATGDYEEVSRMTLTARGSFGEAAAVNDVVIHKLDSSRAVRIRVDISGKHLATYRADGVVVATPTGSTAYALSAGGPVVDSAMEAVVVVPVAPHNMFGRSVVAAPDAEVVLTPGDRGAVLSIDGVRLGELPPDEAIMVVRGARPARFITLGDGHFLSVLHARFGID